MPRSKTPAVLLVGRTFGRLTVLSVYRRWFPRYEKTMANCSCTCGELVPVRTESLVGGLTQSCGCLRVENSRMLGKILPREMRLQPVHSYPRRRPGRPRKVFDAQG